VAKCTEVGTADVRTEQRVRRGERQKDSGVWLLSKICLGYHNIWWVVHYLASWYSDLFSSSPVT